MHIVYHLLWNIKINYYQILLMCRASYKEIITIIVILVIIVFTKAIASTTIVM